MEFFFGKEIHPDEEQKTIESVLKKYEFDEANDALKKKIYNELVDLKRAGKISIPFQVVLRNDIFKRHRPYIEIMLDTKV